MDALRHPWVAAVNHPNGLRLALPQLGIISIGVVPMGVVSIGVVPMGGFSLGVVGMGVVNACVVGMGVLVSGLHPIGLWSLTPGNHPQEQRSAAIQVQLMAYPSK